MIHDVKWRLPQHIPVNISLEKYVLCVIFGEMRGIFPTLRCDICNAIIFAALHPCDWVDIAGKTVWFSNWHSATLISTSSAVFRASSVSRHL
jgi:hypothetical protein